MEEPLTSNELNSELTGLNKGDKEKKRNQILIDAGIGITICIVMVIIIVLATSGSSDSSENDGRTQSSIGEINLIYDVQSSLGNTKLLGNEYNKESSDFDIVIDGKVIKYSKEYKFDSVGEINVQIKLYSNLNMDYMFKDVEDLISVNMTSNDGCQIISMISSFEGTISLQNFTITGFGADQLKSMHKLFYKSSLNLFTYSSFDTKNLEDMSYMFASSSISVFLFNGFNTNKVTNMSHMFEDCAALLWIGDSGINAENLIDMSYMFKDLISITFLELQNFKTNKVKDMSFMFQNSISLTELVINNFDTSSVTNMAYMFDNCFSLK